MAYILKSNVVVNDPEGRFEFYSKYGKAPKDVAKYVKDLEQSGYSVSVTEFNALRDFVNNLEQGMVWDKVREAYPIMGGNLEGASIKLKSLNSVFSMSPLNGFDKSRLEMVNGKVLGKKATPATSTGNQPMLNTHVKVSDLGEDVGFHFYAGGVTNTGASIWQPLIGAITADSVSATRTELAVNIETSNITATLNTVPRSASASFVGSTGVIGGNISVNVAGVSNKSAHYFNGVETSSTTAVNTNNGTDRSVELALFGRVAPNVPSQTGASTAYSGFVRFGCITSGNLTGEQTALLHREINKLMVALGKSA